MIEWDYHRSDLIRHRDMLVPVEYVTSGLVMRIVDLLIDMGIYPRTQSVMITEERVEVEMFPMGLDHPRHPGPYTIRDYRYNEKPCQHVSWSFIIVHRSWPLLELLAGENVT